MIDTIRRSSNHSGNSSIESYLEKWYEFIDMLCRLSNVYTYLSNHSHDNVKSVMQHIQPPYHSILSDIKFDINILSRSAVRIEGSDLPQINGLYNNFQINPDSKNNQHPTFFRRVINENGTGYDQLMIHRCRLSEGTSRWYISTIPKGCKPGEKTDIDWYEAYSYYDSAIPLTNDITPPVRRWIKIINRRRIPSDTLRVHWLPINPQTTDEKNDILNYEQCDTISSDDEDSIEEERNINLINRDSDLINHSNDDLSLNTSGLSLNDLNPVPERYNGRSDIDNLSYDYSDTNSLNGNGDSNSEDDLYDD